MIKPTNIAHPLKNRSGSSQGNRNPEALSPGYAPVDDKSLGDRLYLISKYASLINYDEVQEDPENKEYQQADNWTDFFKNSLPFQLANFSKISTEDLESRFSVLLQALKENPSKLTLEALLNFIYNEIILPTATLYSEVIKSGNSFITSILSIIKSSFQEPLRRFISLYNAATTFLCITRKNFDPFLKEPWALSVSEIYALNPCIQQVKKGKTAGYLLAGEIAFEIFEQFVSGLGEIIEAAPVYIQESLHPLKASLQEKHEPHLALLFTFLEIFKHLQGNINELGKKHLDFFYKNVLQLTAKDAVADKAHIIFEIAKHLENGYLLPKDLLLRDGKDVNKQDIQFGLDQELILDKAKISQLRSLSLYPVKNNDNDKFIEGVYIAPVANSLDGKGEKIKDALNWSTLGDKFSKKIIEGKEQPEANPKARLGFVLSSPVLLLEEGKRDLTITLNCNLSEKLDGLSPIEKEALIDHIEQKLSLAGSENIYLLSDFFIEECNKNLAEENKLSLVAKQYISKLLITQNLFEVKKEKLDIFLEAKDQVSCEPVFTANDKNKITNCLNSIGFASKTVEQPLFRFYFSGEKEWIQPASTLTIKKKPLAGGADFQFKFDITLDPEDPPVVFYNEENLKEKLDLVDNFPLVKIELNGDLKILCDNDDSNDEKCCLRKGPDPAADFYISPYELLQDLIVTDAKIDVTVCGVKNLIVQNDENLQDVNKPIMPFGPRPKVGQNWDVDKGANFYIGSKEVFCKNWQRFWINTTWKDKPGNLHDHYRYYRGDNFENNDIAITDLSFRFLSSFLNNGNWVKDEYNVNEPPAPNLVDAGGIDNHWDDDYSSEYFADETLLLHDLFPLFENSKEFTDAEIDAGEEEDPNPCIGLRPGDTYSHKLKEEFFTDYEYRPKSMPEEDLEPLSIKSRKGFLRLTLAGISFQHDRYPYVLARQMMALANLLDPESIELVKNDLELLKKLSNEAKNKMASIISEINNVIGHVDSLNDTRIPGILSLAITIEGHLDFINTNYDANPLASKSRVTQALTDIGNLIDEIGNSGNFSTILGQLDHAKGDLDQINDFIKDNPAGDSNGISDDNINNNLDSYGLEIILVDMERRIIRVANTLDVDNVGGTPNEPFTPLIKSLSIDYKAVANIDDMELLHLYPYEITSKHENIEENPTLLPYFEDEGTLFIGLEEVTAGGNLSLLFQLAEATADSDQNRATINWYYLNNNSWRPLLPDFDIISDATDGLTVSGIINIALPEDINKKGHTIMPDDLYWLKVSAPSNVKAIAETIGIHTQAALTSARFSELSDKQRLDNPLPAGSISKTVNSDFNLKKVSQLYDSFGGRQPEVSGHFYVRVSEQLKHKNRGIMIQDYEKIILEAFPEIYKVKCISHSMGLSAKKYRRDLEIAPGYVIIAVIPDLEKLKPGNLMNPKVPVSLLEKIGDHIRKKVSAFARLKVMNPRYEPIDVNIEVRLYRGKSGNFYAKKLKEEISQFLAPWFLGDSEKLAFGQEINFSDLVGFVEQRDYVDFIKNTKLMGKCDQKRGVIQPLTARSILTGGRICIIINEEECEKAAYRNEIIIS
ncbi:baseplate J/gp47 family protein [Autumnicola psychrophila]|uniref:Baseplate J/gp47 family protein n=1 Tax=Autumnicola psychrophila TaxID=3075592 RepID=A0ABU3DTF7_9FLAO|nr:baseplate J/gp47 family protein [Zunongwangia sp. F225]MDT0687008.1 baseplate J/gp47 family protein [Zunongwangia sp. F225]